MIKFITAIFISLNLTYFALAQAPLPLPKPTLPPSLVDWQTYFYLDKNFSKVEEFIKALDERKVIEGNNNVSFYIFSHFLADLIDENPQFMMPTITKKRYERVMQRFLVTSYYHSEMGRAASLQARQTQPLHPFVPNILLQNITHPVQLDALFAKFAASGKAAYISKLLSVLDEKTELSGKEPLDTAIRKSALWGLRMNTAQHLKIERIIHQELSKQPEPVQKLLTDMLADNERRLPRLAHQNGNFSADLVPVNDKGLKEFDNPSSQGVKIEVLSKIKPDEKIHLKIVFAGFEVSNDSQYHVVYDLEIIDPNGKVQKAGNIKNLLASKGLARTRFNIFNNDNAIVVMALDKKEPRGKYTINAVIRDEIGKKTLKISKSIELID